MKKPKSEPKKSGGKKSGGEKASGKKSLELQNGDTLGRELKRICVDAGGYPDAWPRHTACPACNASTLVPSFSKMGFSHSRCTSCHFVCVNPYPTETVIKALYEGEYYTKIRLLFEQPLLRKSGAATPFSAPVEDLKTVVAHASKGKPKGSWLDVGGGLGAFAALVRDSLPEWQVGLNELNEASIAVARELFDFDIVTASAGELKASKKRYDVISSVAVAEHIPDPLAFLQSYFDLVRPGGCLVTVIPHFSMLNIFVSKGSSANAAPPYHTSLFNEEAFRRMLARLKGVENSHIEQAGPPAFELIQVADYGDHWDISIPTEDHPVPRSLQIKPYDEEIGQTLAALSAVGAHLNEEFSRLDGKQWLIGYCWKSRNPSAQGVSKEQASIDAEHKKFVLQQKREMRLATEAAALEQSRIEADHHAFVQRQQEETRLAIEASAADQARIEAEHHAFVQRQQEETRLAIEKAAAEQARIDAEHHAFVQHQLEEMRLATEAAATAKVHVNGEPIDGEPVDLPATKARLSNLTQRLASLKFFGSKSKNDGKA
jgi:SAM-dependent methyltransferase